MIPRDASPIGHVPPLRRIDLYGPKPGDPNVCPPARLSEAVQDRIWRAVVATAESTNTPTRDSA